MQLLLQGEQRGIAMRITEKDGYLEAHGARGRGDAAAQRRGPGVRRPCSARRASAPPSWARSRACPRRSSTRCSRASTDPGRLADLVAGLHRPAAAQRQALLETLSVEERLRRVLVHVQRQIEVLDGAGGHQVARSRRSWATASARCSCASSSRRSRRSSARATARDDVEELREKLAKLDLPEEARKEVDRELGRLGRMGREAMESQVIRTYLETIAELPWGARSPSTSTSPRRRGSSTRTTTAWAT